MTEFNLKDFQKLVQEMSWLKKCKKKIPKAMHYKFYYINGYLNGIELEGGRARNDNKF